MKNFRATATLLMCLTTTACQSPDNSGSAMTEVAPTQPRQPVVYTVNYPLAWMAGQIAGDSVKVVFPIPTGIDPAHWRPGAEDILRYQQADRILLNGANYAGWVSFAALSPGRLVDTAAGARDRFVPLGGTTHTHGPTGDHEHGDIASHTWLDPTLAAIQAGVVTDTLIDLLPDEKETLENNSSALITRLGSLDTLLAEEFSGWRDRGVLYSHPVYQYLDSRYALDGRSLTWEPDQPPGEKQWQRLAAMLEERPATIMFWEATPSSDTASRLIDLGITPIVFEVSGNRPEAGDYLLAMNANLQRIRELK
jgi:zinc transport system substrate-binding protein